MLVIPVLDIRQGRAVHAVAGDRARYGPLRSVLPGGTDPVALAGAGLDAWGLVDLYVADLDAIAGGAPGLAVYRAMADLGLTLWVDAGVRGPADVPGLVDSGVARVVVGLETVAGPAALGEIVRSAGADRVAFSLDLRDGSPMVETRPAWGSANPVAIAARAIAEGARRIIELDLARVGTGRPPRARSIADLVRLDPGVDWIVGGGIGGIDDLSALAGAGARGALVGSALHDGRIGAEGLRAWRISGRRPSS